MNALTVRTDTHGERHFQVLSEVPFYDVTQGKVRVQAYRRPHDLILVVLTADAKVAVGFGRTVKDAADLAINSIGAWKVVTATSVADLINDVKAVPDPLAALVGKVIE